MKKNPVLPEIDTIVIGNGVAGLSSALMLGRARRQVLLLDSGQPRNRYSEHMHGVLGNDGSSPLELLDKGRHEVARYGAQFLDSQVIDVQDIPLGLRVTLENGETRDARTLVVATGLTDILPKISGISERWGKSVFHCPYCHGWEGANHHIGVLATSAASLHQVQLLSQWSDRVTFFSGLIGELDPEFEQKLLLRNIQIVSSPVTEIIGEQNSINAVRVADGQEIPVEAIFLLSEMQPRDQFLKNLELERTELPFGTGTVLATDQSGKTSHDRIWAAGNISNPMANVPMSIGAGSFTGGAVNGALVEEDFNREDRKPSTTATSTSP